MQCSNLVAVLILALVSSVRALLSHPTLPRLQCMLRFARLDFQTDNFDRYHEFYRDDSVMTLAQAGDYHGADGIEEYVKFAFSQYSPYFASGPNATWAADFLGYKRKTGQCMFLARYYGLYAMDPNYTSTNTEIKVVYMIKMAFHFTKKYIKKVSVFYPEEVLRLFFTDFLDADITRQYLCGIMTGVCSSKIETPANCTNELAALPTVDDPGTYFDGKSQGCRALHAVLAQTNEKHCPHISFTPMADSNGRIKCQQSASMPVSDVFSEREMKMYRSWCSKNGVDPNIGYTLP